MDMHRQPSFPALKIMSNIPLYYTGVSGIITQSLLGENNPSQSRCRLERTNKDVLRWFQLLLGADTGYGKSGIRNGLLDDGFIERGCGFNQSVFLLQVHNRG